MNTKPLTYILAIAQTKTLSAAAKKLGISQPALSKYLNELQTELSAELFYQHKKQLYPTPAGQIYIDAAQKIISVKEQTYQMIHSLSGAPQKTITIAVSPLRGAILMASVYPIFRKRYPHIQISLLEQYSYKLRQSVIDRTADISLGTCIDPENPEEPELLIFSAYEEEVVLFVPSFHPLASRASRDPDHLTSIDIREFQDTPFLLSDPGQTFRKITDILFQQNHMYPTVVFESSNNLVLKNMVNSGAGVCILPRSSIDASSQVVHFLLNPTFMTHLAIMVRRDRILSEEERYLIALMLEHQRADSCYIYNPTPLTKEIIDEFHLDDAPDFQFT